MVDFNWLKKKSWIFITLKNFPFLLLHHSHSLFFGFLGSPKTPKSLSQMVTTLFNSILNLQNSQTKSTKRMSQGYAIELYFDPALENQVLKAWNVFARRQISTYLINNESRPHITLFSTTSSIDSTKLEPIIKSFSSKQEPISLSFSSIGSFSSKRQCSVSFADAVSFAY